MKSAREDTIFRLEIWLESMSLETERASLSRLALWYRLVVPTAAQRFNKINWLGYPGPRYGPGFTVYRAKPDFVWLPYHGTPSILDTVLTS
jgi:hypothetical protein